MKNRLIAILVVVCTLCVVNTRGAIAVPKLPTSLEQMGSAEKFRSWAVTSQMVSVNNILYYTNLSGAVGNWGSFGGKTFTSLSAYQKFTGSNSFKLFNERKSLMDPTKGLRFVVFVRYHIPQIVSDDLVDVLVVNTNIGLVSGINSNSFVMAPTLKELAYIPVPFLDRFVVEVEGLYTNSWPAEAGRPLQVPPAGVVGVPSPYPPELTTNNWVVLNSWYSDGTKDTTITLTVGGKTRQYGRFGEARFQSGTDQAPLLSLQGNTIAASFARGSTVTFQSSSNLTHWTTMTNFTDSGMKGYIYIPLAKNKPREFFRISSK